MPEESERKYVARTRPIGSREIHVWQVDLKRPDRVVSTLLQTLSAGEHERLARRRAGDLRRRFTVSHGALRDILSEYVGRPPGTLRLALDARGSPSLEGEEHGGLHFNLAHSGEIALVAVATGRRIGVDVERVRRVDAVRLAARFFSQEEAARIGAAGEIAGGLAFFMSWVGKEALLKGMSGSFLAALRRAVPQGGIGRGATGNTITPERAADPPWTVSSWMIEDRYAAAVAVEGREPALRHVHWRA